MDLLPLGSAYLLTVSGVAVVYLLIFFWRRDLQAKMIRTGLWGAVIGPISQWWYLNDYWRPQHTLVGTLGEVFEDALFGFAIVGAMAGLIMVLLRVKVVAAPGQKSQISRYLAVPIMIAFFAFLTTGLHINSMHASPGAFLVLTGFIWWQRPDLIKWSLLSGVVWLFLTIAGYTVIISIWPDFFARWWLWDNISKITILRIPIEELLWFTTLGFLAGVAHEWRQGLKFVAI